MQITVIIIAITLIGLILWWFFAPRKNTTAIAKSENNHQQITITVSGGYSPEIVELKQGIPATLVFHRENPSNCFDEVVFPDFGIRQRLPVDKDFSIDMPTDKTGEFRYSCGMHMFFGKVIVK